MPYQENTYHKEKIIPKKIENEQLTKKDWLEKNIHINIFRNYFRENLQLSSLKCIEFLKGKFGKDIEINDEIKKEINSAKVVINMNIKNR